MAQGIRVILDARKRDVLRALDELKRKQIPLERELEDINVAFAAIGDPATDEELDGMFEASGGKNDIYQRMSYRQMTEKLLEDHFPDGATIQEMLTFIRSQWGREVAVGSFSPVLSRMLQSGYLEKSGKTWILVHEPEPEDPNHGL